MSYIPIEKLLDKAGGSVYKLVVAASKRALELAEGQPKLLETVNSVKPSSIALEEIAAGKVKIKNNY
jgi:DNA-directed RNA polymerase subunit omega